MKFLSPQRWWRGFALFVYFMKEVVVANLQVARLVLFVPNEKIQPSILSMPLKAQSDLEIFLLTSMITLTPGTQSLSVTLDRKLLFFHVIDCPNADDVIRSIQDGFERRLLEVTR